jgi:hypothetical protein
MNKIIEFFEDVKNRPGNYVPMLILALVLLASLYVLGTATDAEWRHMYCTSGEAQAIECTAKGWW